jgi:hypothetical protein
VKKWLSVLVLFALLAAVAWLVNRQQQPVQAPAEPQKPEESVASKAAEPSPVVVVDSEKAPVIQSAVNLQSTDNLMLSDAVKTVLNTNTLFRTRAETIKNLSRDLSADDVTALRNFLNLSASDYPNLKPIALNSLKNDILDVLLDQRQLPEGLGTQIAGMFSNPSADYMWREYCLQYMAPYVERQIKDGVVQKAEQNDPKQVEMTAVTGALFSALDDRKEDLAGTALLGLDRLSKKHEQFSRTEVLSKALEIAGDKRASARCRLTAMRVASAGGVKDILPTARDLAQNGETVLLRGAAITTLGDFGAPEDMDLLKTLSSSPNRQIAAAAQAAVKRFGP